MWLLAKQFLPSRGKNGIYFETELFLTLKSIELSGSHIYEDVKQIVSYGWKKICKLVHLPNTDVISSGVNV